MPRRSGGEGKYQSLITGKFVSAYCAKRHPKTTVRADQPKPRVPLLSGGDGPTLAERFEEELTKDAGAES